jgi:hypothetical protein
MKLFDVAFLEAMKLFSKTVLMPHSSCLTRARDLIVWYPALGLWSHRQGTETGLPIFALPEEALFFFHCLATPNKSIFRVVLNQFFYI